MKILITGVTGFAGSHLADFALARGDVEVFGTARWRSPNQNIEHIADKITVVDADLRILLVNTMLRKWWSRAGSCRRRR